ncbi:MAG: glycosyltransferase [Candidatus Tectomicrobia bacterium]|nr:glycosyltransferase [Candidatus Tectomicrobia bacterium]
MKVLAVIDGFLPPFVERTGLRVLAALFRRLVARGCDLHVLTTIPAHVDPNWRTWVDDQWHAGLRLHPRPEPFGSLPRLAFLGARFRLAPEVARLQRAHGFDLIHEYSSSPWLANRTALYRCTGAATLHSLITCNETWLGDPRGCRLFPDLLLCASRRDYEALRRRRPERVAYLPLGIEVAAFSSAEPRRCAGTGKPPVILYLGPLEERKGIGTLLRAAVLLQRPYPAARFVIATHACNGRGYAYAAARRKLLATADATGMQLDLREGYLDVPRLLAEADILAYPLTSLHGTLHQPATLLEAMAAGTAVVATALPAIQEIVTEGVDGLLAPPNDAAALAARLATLLEHPSLRWMLAGNAARRAAQFDLEPCAATLLRHYEAILQSAPRRLARPAPRQPREPLPAAWSDLQGGPAAPPGSPRLSRGGGLRLVFLTDITPTTGSWIGRYEPLARELVKLGHQVTILAPHPSYGTLPPAERVSWRDGVIIRSVGSCFYRQTARGRRYRSTATILRLAAGTLCRMVAQAWSSRYDALLVAKPLPLASCAALLLRLLRRRPVVVDCDDFEPATNNPQGAVQRRALQLSEALAPRLAHHVTTHSAFLARRLLARGVRLPRLTYLPNGIDARRLGEGWPPRLDLGRPVRILYCGDLNLESGHHVDLLLQAAAQARQQTAFPFQIDIVGDGRDEHVLRRLAARLGIDSLVAWHGRIDPFAVRETLARAQIAVDPVSLTPGNLGRCPLKVLEAMHAGLPVITSAVGERRRLLQDAGVYVPAGDAPALGEALRLLIEAPGLRHEVGRRAAALALPYRWSTLARRFEHLLQGVIRKERS